MSREMLNECMAGHVRLGYQGLCITAMAGKVVSGVDVIPDWYIEYKKLDWFDFAERYIRPAFSCLVANLEDGIEAEVRRIIEPAMDSFFKDIDKSLGATGNDSQGKPTGDQDSQGNQDTRGKP